MAERQLTQEYVRSLFEYDPETGVLTWKERPIESCKSKSAWMSVNARFAGKPAGAFHRGYLRMIIGGVSYYLHRVIWLLVHGEWPETVDHIDGDKLNNRLVNLRSVSQRENMKNCRRSVRNTSGITGVSFRSADQTWIAYITQDGKRVHLGTFSAMDEAVSARKSAEKQFGYHPNHGN